MHVTAKADYAVRAVIELAESKQDAPRKVDDVAQAQGIPVSFLENILTQLRSSGIVRSQRGPEGGYWLAQPADERALDGANDLREAHLRGGLGQPVPAFGAALAAHDARRAKLREDVLQERDRDALALRNVIYLARRVLPAVGELDHRAHRVVGLGCHVHPLILAKSAAEDALPASRPCRRPSPGERSQPPAERVSSIRP
jgi:hypothetical protein